MIFPGFNNSLVIKRDGLNPKKAYLQIGVARPGFLLIVTDNLTNNKINLVYPGINVPILIRI